MSRDLFLSSLAAAALHAGALFGLRVGTSAVALPMREQPGIEVNLVAEIPAEPVEAPDEPPPLPEPAPVSPPIDQPPPPDIPMALPPEDKTLPSIVEPRPEQEKPSAPVARPRITKQFSARSTDARSFRGMATMARPRYRSNPPPIYPSEARRQRQEGTVIVGVEVTSQGRAASAAIQRSSGFSALDQAAVAAVRHWTFEPGRVGGLPVSSRVEIPVRFRLAE